MPGVIQPALINYNGFDFSVMAEIVSIAQRPHYDPAGRMLAWTSYTFTIRDYFGVGTGDSAGTIRDLQTNLKQPGGVLTITGIGLADRFVFNTVMADVRYGPHPDSLTFRQVGADQTWELTWVVRVDVAGECQGNLLGVGSFGAGSGVLEFTYEVSWNIDPTRQTRRTYTCQARVPAVRKGPTVYTLPDHADRVREKCTPAIPFGFRRATDNWALSSDKTELRGTVVDEQLHGPNVPPKDVILADASHSIDSSKVGFARWTVNIRASYTITPDKPRTVALAAFKGLLGERLAVIQSVMGKGGGGGLLGSVVGLLGSKPRVVLIPTRFSFEEPEIYGMRGASFVFQAAVTIDARTTSLVSNAAIMLAISGLWRPAGSWDIWKASLASALGPRGTAGMLFSGSEDVLINLCTSAGATPVIKTPLPGGGGGGGGGGGDLGLAGLGRKIGVLGDGEDIIDAFAPDITPASSYLDYQVELEIKPIDNTVVLPLLPIEPVRYVPLADDPLAHTDGFRVPYQTPRQPPFVVQYRGVPMVFAILRGQATRALYNVTPPELISIGGVNLVPWNGWGDGVRHRVVSNALVPLCVCAWQKTYLVPHIPSQGIGAPANPLLGALAPAQGSAQAPSQQQQQGFVVSGQ